MESIDSILDFWFGADAEVDEAAAARSHSKLWWSKNPLLDKVVAQRFEKLIQAAAMNELADWSDTPRGLLALLLLTDQFPRNIYRGSSRAFAFDHLALGLCLAGIERGFDLRLTPLMRAFFYLPLEHSESIEHQARSVELFAKLASEAPDSVKSLYRNYLDYALAHQKIIARFGRFPHRNRALGRSSTEAELAWLSEPGAGF